MILLLYFNGIIEVVVDQDPAAILANDDFLSLPDFTLALGRDGIKATTAGIADNGNNGEAVTVILPDAVVRMQDAWLDFFSRFRCQFTKMLFLLFSRRNDLVELFLFIFQNVFFSADILFCPIKECHFFCNLFVGIFDVFFGQFHFELLHFNFFIDCFELAAVFYILTLLLIFLYKRFRIFDQLFLLIHEFLDSVNLLLNACLPGMQALDFVFKIADFHWQFALQYLVLIQ